MEIGIIADSCCDLTPALRRLLKVDIVSLTINVDGKQYVDDEALDTKRLLAEMKAYKGAPSTACPSPEAYAAAMEQYDACFVVTLSGNLSGSCNAARIGREMLLERCPRKKVHVVDSESASAGQTLLAMLLRDGIDSGRTFEAITEEITAFVARMQTRFVLEDLSNLVKNGRISRVAGLLGGSRCGPLWATTGTAILRPSKRCAARKTQCAVWWSLFPILCAQKSPPAAGWC